MDKNHVNPFQSDPEEPLYSLTMQGFLLIIKVQITEEVITMESIVTLISQVGFPIACCVYLFTQQNKLIGTLGEISTTMALMNKSIEDILKNQREED